MKQPYTLNPWFTLWTKPRASMRAILDADPKRMVVLLAALGGIGRALDMASLWDLGEWFSVPAILVTSLCAGSAMGIVMLYISGLLLSWTGTWLKGRATPVDARSAVAWSTVPEIWALLLWIPELVLFGADLFVSDMSDLFGRPALLIVYLLFIVIELIIVVWAIIMYLKCLAEAQRFSVWRALANALIVFCILTVPVGFAIRTFFGYAGL
ncbi:MAG TPA: YIP1 family protein [Nitrospiraceae bacterium]|nr:YIP1 family protein [Nitrospiraceae bacterium]